MVRLKEVELMQIYPDEKDFNSTMVRLKATTDSVITLSPPIFQFHYGSVKSFCGANNSLNEAVFQFHYGSVKSLLLFDACSTCSNFNSTMVRLKVPETQDNYAKNSNFNSTMVRLKASAATKRTTSVQISIPLWFG